MPPKTNPLFVRLPPPIAKLVEEAAKENRRSRSSEVCLRLEKSFKPKQPKATSGAAK